MTSKIKEMEKQFSEENFEEEKDQVKRKAKGTEKNLLDLKKKRLDSQEESGGSESDISVVYEKVQRRKEVVGVFTRIS